MDKKLVNNKEFYITLSNTMRFKIKIKHKETTQRGPRVKRIIE